MKGGMTCIKMRSGSRSSYGCHALMGQSLVGTSRNLAATAFWRACSLRLLFVFSLALCSLCGVSNPAYADVDPASTMFGALVGGALNSTMAYNNVVDDLVKRWYAADPVKRDKIPVRNYFAEVDDPVYPNYYPQLTDYGGYWEWKFNSILADLNFPNRLAAFDSGNMVKEGSPALEIEYKKWYDWFESTSSGEGSTPGNTDNGEYVRIGLIQSIPNSSALNTNVKIGTTTYSYGPVPNANMQKAPDVLYVNVPKGVFDSSSYDGEPCYLQISTGIGGSVNMLTLPDNNKTYEWTPLSLMYAGVTYEVQKNTYGKGLIKYVSWSSNEYVVTDGEVYLNNKTLWNSQSQQQGTGEFTGYSSYQTFNGTYTPPDEPAVPTEPIPAPEPTYPAPVMPTPPTEPTNGVVSNPVVTDLEEFQNWLDGALATYFGDVIKWLKYIAEWEETISGQFYDFEGSAINLWRQTNAWLRKIYYKWTGGGGPNIDPVTNPDDDVSWWDALLKWIMGLLPDALADLITTIGTLNRYFPFSIPTDVGMILGLFAETPQSPVFDIVLYPDNAALTYTGHFDLSGFDQYAYIVRSAISLWFAMVLMMWTPDVIRQTSSLL